jgi:hypothetical protein
VLQAASEFHSYSEESLTVPAQLCGLLFQLGITKAPDYKVKSIPRLGHMEFTYTVEVFDGQEVVGKHTCHTPVLKAQNQSLHTCTQDVQITRLATI